MNREAPVYRLFERFGIELEYMIVDRASLAVRPIADALLQAASDGGLPNDIAVGSIIWSNEMVRHVIEMKSSGPVSSFDGLDKAFCAGVRKANALLRPQNAELLGGGMHPFMDPARETRLWPHDNSEIYRTFDRLFDCNRHGWANLQSTHVNVPFANDEEFGRLHAAVRLVLPVIPALAASSPFADGRVTWLFDTRMEMYRTNSAHVPSITGELIPEPIFTVDEYRNSILEPIYRDLAALDPEETLCEEWANARGAIARFERNTIEIRVIDAQETPAADLAIAAAVIGVVKLLAGERFGSLRDQMAWPVGPLKKILLDTVRCGERAEIADGAYLHAFGMMGEACSGRDLWAHLIQALVKYEGAWIAPHAGPLERILAHGTLASRILAALGGDVSRERIESVYRGLCGCLQEGVLF
jgi:carboxylate-amine ligase